jgi:hypothetical protein
MTAAVLPLLQHRRRRRRHRHTPPAPPRTTRASSRRRDRPQRQGARRDVSASRRAVAARCRCRSGASCVRRCIVGCRGEPGLYSLAANGPYYVANKLRRNSRPSTSSPLVRPKSGSSAGRRAPLPASAAASVSVTPALLDSGEPEAEGPPETLFQHAMRLSKPPTAAEVAAAHRGE